MHKLVIDGDGHSFQTRFTEFLREHLPLFRAPSHKEKVHQALGFMLIHILSKRLDGTYVVRMAQDDGVERSHITAHPRALNCFLSLIFEVKAVTSHHKYKGTRQLKPLLRIRNELRSAAAAALKQVEDRRNLARAPPHVTEVHEFGVAFSGKFCIAAVRTLVRDSSAGDWVEVKVDTVDVREDILEGDLLVDDGMDA
jgi:hypothetical protein